MDRPQLAIMFGANSDGRKAELANKIAALDGLIAEADQSIENLLNILQRRLSGVVEQRLAEQEKALADLRAEREALDTQLQSEPTGEDWTTVLETLERDLAGVEANVRWNANLKRIIDRVEAGLFNFGEYLAVDVFFHGVEKPVKVASSPIDGGGWQWPKLVIDDGWGGFEYGWLRPDDS